MSVSLQTDTLTPFNWCHIVISLSPGRGDAVTLSPAQLSSGSGHLRIDLDV